MKDKDWNAPQHAAHEMSTRIRAAHMTIAAP
jgi:hypothetical protein